MTQSEADIRRIVQSMKRIAVLGIKTEEQAGQPAFEVPRYLQMHGLDVIPVPVYYPDVQSILGRTVFRTLAQIPGEIDLVDVFRRPRDIDAHLVDIITKKPRVVWFQSGIRNDEAAKTLAAAGIEVVQDRCLMVDHRRYA